MQINFQDLIKEQIVFILLPILFIAAAIGGAGYCAKNMFDSMQDAQTQEKKVAELTTKKESLEAELKRLVKEESNPENKQIFSLEGMKFGAEASFAPLFDDMIKIAKASGIRIRSVDYNYAPQGDPIYGAKATGINTCELSATIVGTYPQIQTFLKTLLSETYLINISQVEIVSWKRDKSILIANLKLVYYTKTN